MTADSKFSACLQRREKGSVPGSSCRDSSAVTIPAPTNPGLTSSWGQHSIGPMAQAGGGVDAGGVQAEPLGSLLSGVVDLLFGEEEDAKAVAVSEEALRGKLYPDTTHDDFKALLNKVKGLLKAMATADMDSTQLESFLAAQVRKPGGVTAEQAAILARFWKSHRGRVRESLVARCRWEPTLHGVNWRVDVPAANGHSGDQSGAPIAFLELDIGHEGQEPDRLSLELDEAGIAKIMKSVTAIEQRIAKLGQ